MRTIVTTILFFVFSVSVLCAQNDAVIFKAMKEEMERNRTQLTMDKPDTPPILFISYTLADTRFVNASAAEGVILQTIVNPTERISSVRLIVGDNTFSSDYSYSGNGLMGTNYVTVEDNPSQIKAAFWVNSDVAYKFAVEAYNSKKSNIKNANLTDEEKELPEYIPMQAKEVIATHKSIPMGIERYEELATKLSSEFGGEPSVVLSTVDVSGIETVYYYLSSEGVKSKQAVKYVDITLRAKVRLPSGQMVREEKYMAFPDLDEMPDYKALRAEVQKFSEHLTAVRRAEKVDEYYLGPVLFENEAVAKIFSDNLISLSGLLSFRKPIQVTATVARAENISEMSRAKSLEERLGKKVLDSRLSVYNVTDLKKMNGLNLLGSYSVDAQGVAPKSRIPLIQNGILTALLTQNVPTVKCKESTGSYRWGTKARSMIQEIAPGALLIEAPNGNTRAELKEALITCAKEEGLEYGYIVRKLGASDQLLYRVSVKDGSETLVINGELSPVPLAKLKRVLGVAKDQYVQNFIHKDAIPCAIVCPSGLLIEDVEVNVKRPSIQKDSRLIK